MKPYAISVSESFKSGLKAVLISNNTIGKLSIQFADVCHLMAHFRVYALSQAIYLWVVGYCIVFRTRQVGKFLEYFRFKLSDLIVVTTAVLLLLDFLFK